MSQLLTSAGRRQETDILSLRSNIRPSDYSPEQAEPDGFFSIESGEYWASTPIKQREPNTAIRHKAPSSQMDVRTGDGLGRACGLGFDIIAWGCGI